MSGVQAARRVRHARNAGRTDVNAGALMESRSATGRPSTLQTTVVPPRPRGR